MSALLTALRFMRVVPPVPRLMHTACACVALSGMGAIAMDPAAAPQTLGPLLMLQLFAVSTGFCGYVRRGYYDLLLTGGISRLTVAAAQWTMAALPGTIAWIALGLTEAMVREQFPELFSPRAASIVWTVSTLPWACTVALPRFSAAIGLSVAWVAVMAMGLRTADALSAAAAAGTSSGVLLHRAGDWLRAAATGAEMATFQGGAAWGPLLLATMAVAAALAWIRQASFPLESGQ